MKLIEDLRSAFRVTKRGELIRLKSLGGPTFKGQKVSGWLDYKGYMNITFRQKGYKKHRIIFAIIHGFFPPAIDHKNRKRADNRPLNLRASTPALNSTNKTVYKNSSSGVSGLDKFGDGWRARVYHNKKSYHLGRSKNKKILTKRIKDMKTKLFKQQTLITKEKK